MDTGSDFRALTNLMKLMKFYCGVNLEKALARYAMGAHVYIFEFYRHVIAICRWYRHVVLTLLFNKEILRPWTTLGNLSGIFGEI